MILNTPFPFKRNMFHIKSQKLHEKYGKTEIPLTLCIMLNQSLVFELPT